ncbi:MAG: phosphoribosylaminoimidazolesuccinocarboxamide synthase [Acidobacteriota bacterium]
MGAPAVLLQTNFPELNLRARGKVRDVYDLGDQLLIVATDRISAFDYILGSGIPRKGHVLNQMSLFWFDLFKPIIRNHVVAADVSRYPASLQRYAADLAGRSMLVKKAEPLPVECVVRGYLSGSGWKEYRESGSVCGIPLPEGLLESSKLPAAIFTPATKATSGHDLNVPFEQVEEMVGASTAKVIQDASLRIYEEAARYALERGILVADTKFEFGVCEGETILIDEVLTPDSSRFWPAADYSPGRPQKSYDKQFVRDYLEEIRWNKQPPAPALPDQVVEATSQKYCEAFERLTGKSLK